MAPVALCIVSIVSESATGQCPQTSDDAVTTLLRLGLQFHGDYYAVVVSAEMAAALTAAGLF